jgi:hypothetical protein
MAPCQQKMTQQDAANFVLRGPLKGTDERPGRGHAKPAVVEKIRWRARGRNG